MDIIDEANEADLRSRTVNTQTVSYTASHSSQEDEVSISSNSVSFNSVAPKEKSLNDESAGFKLRMKETVSPSPIKHLPANHQPYDISALHNIKIVQKPLSVSDWLKKFQEDSKRGKAHQNPNFSVSGFHRKETRRQSKLVPTQPSLSIPQHSCDHMTP